MENIKIFKEINPYELEDILRDEDILFCRIEYLKTKKIEIWKVISDYDTTKRTILFSSKNFNEAKENNLISRFNELYKEPEIYDLIEELEIDEDEQINIIKLY